MKKLVAHSLEDYSRQLSLRKPIPGGGSAAAYTAALGVGLISMVSRYSIRIGQAQSVQVVEKIEEILKKSERVRRQLIRMVDKDAEAYLKVVAARKASSEKKIAAFEGARNVALEISRLCFQALELTPYLVAHGSKYLISDIEVAVELLFAAFKSAMIIAKVNT